MDTQLVLINTIRSQKAKYCRFVDTKMWDDFADLILDKPRLRFFAPDGTLLYGFDSTEEWMKVMKTALKGAQTIHQVHNDEIEVISDTEVRAIWSMEDYLIFAKGDDRPASLKGYGHYHETWLLVDGRWRLAELELRRTILETLPQVNAH